MPPAGVVLAARPDARGLCIASPKRNSMQIGWLKPGKQTASYIGPCTPVARLTWPPAPDRQEGSQGALLTADSMLSGVYRSCSRCFGLGTISLYSIGFTRNPYSIQVISISVFLEADRRPGMRLERQRGDEVHEG